MSYGRCVCVSQVCTASRTELKNTYHPPVFSMFHLHLGLGLVVRSMTSLVARNSSARWRSPSVEVSGSPATEVGTSGEFHSSHVIPACQGTLQEKQDLIPHPAHLTMGSSMPPSWICPLPQPAAH